MIFRIHKKPTFTYNPKTDDMQKFLNRLEMPAPYSVWRSHWANTLYSCHRRDLSVQPLQVKGPIEQRIVTDREKKMGMALPEQLRAFFLTAATFVLMGWHSQNNFSIGDFEFGSIGGHMRIVFQDVIPVTHLSGWNPNEWDEEMLSFWQSDSESWDDIDDIIALLNHSISFMDIGNGDHLVIDTRDGKVKYLSHEGPEAIGVVLGRDFNDFMMRWSQLGCVGPEIWWLEPFLTDEGLNPDCPNGKRFRKWLYAFSSPYSQR